MAYIAISLGDVMRGNVPPQDPANPEKPKTLPPWDGQAPKFRPEDITQEMLTGPLNESQLRNVVDPADFLNRRAAAICPPTVAATVSWTGSRNGLYPPHLSSRAAAVALFLHLRRLGYKGDESTIAEMEVGNPFSFVDWGTETRRVWMIGEYNVGLILQKYAKMPQERADAEVRAELEQRP